MRLLTGQIVELYDAQQRQLGQLTIERCEGDLLLGTFVAGLDFQAVESLFRSFEEAVDLQALSRVEKLDMAIRALGLHLRSPNAAGRLEIHDVQLWSDGGISCRLPEHNESGLNVSLAGAAVTLSPMRPVS